MLFGDGREAVGFGSQRSLAEFPVGEVADGFGHDAVGRRRLGPAHGQRHGHRHERLFAFVGREEDCKGLGRSASGAIKLSATIVDTLDLAS